MELPMRASLSIRCSVRVVVCCPGCIFRRGLHAAPVPFVIVISARQRRAPAIAVAIDRGDFQHPRIAEPAAGGLVTCHANAPRSEEHTSELQSLMRISYAVF